MHGETVKVNAGCILMWLCIIVIEINVGSKRLQMLIYLYVSIMLLFNIRNVQVSLSENRLLEEECKVI